MVALSNLLLEGKIGNIIYLLYLRGNKNSDLKMAKRISIKQFLERLPYEVCNKYKPYHLEYSGDEKVMITKNCLKRRAIFESLSRALRQ